MYYPYFRGKQFDLLALRTLIEAKRLSKKIQPIIEPVKQNTTLTKFLTVSQKMQQPFYLIENPQAGDFLTEGGLATLADLPHNKALIMEQPLEMLDLKEELLIVQQANPALMSEWKDYSGKVLLPKEFRLLNRVQGERILSEDVFTRLPRTSYYQEQPDEMFSTTHLHYQQLGFNGFSDFSIDSRIYYEQGYPSSLLSLHLVYFEEEQLRIHHFLSPEELPTQKDKFLAMMDEVVNWLPRLSQGEWTLGLSLLLDNYNAGKFPGMGVMRKAAVMHHMELMSRYLEQ